MSKDRIKRISKLFKDTVEKKYKIAEIKLFGSFARGESSKHSDIDIMIRLFEVSREIEEDLFDIAYDLELEYDCLIDLVVLPHNVKSYLPMYQNILREGISI
jgi:predicted nucleotidyltransferase